MKWLKSNLAIITIVMGFVISAGSGIAVGAGVTAVLRSDVDKLNRAVFGDDRDKPIAERLGDLETRSADMQNSLNRIESEITK